MEQSLRESLGLPDMEHYEDLARAVGLPLPTVQRMLATPEYRSVRLPKPQGGYRTIDIPSDAFKAVQAWILRAILSPVALDPSATAFRPGYSLLNNVSPHLYQPFVCSLDVVDFFGHIRVGRVIQLFESLGYSRTISHALASLCCFRHHIPQGAVTSPAISNLICRRLDQDIRQFAVLRNVMYTRYADDITLSARSPSALFRTLGFVKSVLTREGFKIHPLKTKVMRPGQKHSITGLVITDTNDITIGRDQYRLLRSAIDRLAKGQELSGFQHGKASILGWLRYLHSVDRKSFEKLKRYWEERLGSLTEFGLG